MGAGGTGREGREAGEGGGVLLSYDRQSMASCDFHSIAQSYSFYD